MPQIEGMIPFTNGPAARTASLQIHDQLDELLSKLIEAKRGGIAVRHGFKKIASNYKEKKADYFQRVDSEIKQAIRHELRLQAGTPVSFERLFLRSDMILFLYLGRETGSAKDFQADCRRYQVDPVRVIGRILSLAFKARLIDACQRYYRIDVSQYNSRIHLDPQPCNPRSNQLVDTPFEAVSIDLLFLPDQQLVVEAHRVAFRCSLMDSLLAQTDDASFIFQRGGKSFLQHKRLNAKTAAKRPFMDYYKYQTCLNYYQTLAVNILSDLLKDLQIGFAPIAFKPNFILHDFLKAKGDLSRELVLIDACSDKVPFDERTKMHQELRELFPGAAILSSDQIANAGDLDPLKNFLIINRPVRKGGSSIAASGRTKPIKSFFKAMALHSRGMIVDTQFDFYTRLKLQRFADELPLVIQGVNVFLPASGKKQGRSTDFNANKVKKIKSEIWLKERVFAFRSFESVDLPDAVLQLFFVRKFRKKQIFIATQEVEIKDRQLRILSSKRYDESMSGEFDFHFPYIKAAFRASKLATFEALHDESFFVYDRRQHVLLTSSSSPAIPAIIGNAAFDNVERSQQSGNIHRRGGSEHCVLPYYVNPRMKKQIHHVFLEDRGLEGLRCFVSQAQPQDPKIDKRSLIRSVAAFDHEGQRLMPLEQDVTDVFLRSFTFDLLRNKETSKKSFLQKIVELVIEN